MNLLILSGSGSSYNSVRPESEIFVGLAKAGHNVTVISKKDNIYTPRFIEHGIRVIEGLTNHKLSLANIKLIKRAIKENNIDIVYATNSRNIPNAAFAAIGTTVKLVVYRGTTGGLYRRDPGTYLTVLHPRVDGVICVSHAVEKRVKKRVWNRATDNVVTIYKGHDLVWYTGPETDISAFGTDKINFNVVCVINARPHKGLIYIIEAAKELADLKDLHILLIGKNISKEPYVSAIENSGMKERIHITGYRNDAPEIIAACDVLVQPSIRKEGLPRVILESLAYKTPVIASANEGSMEIIEENVNGCIVPVQDASGIAEKIRHLHKNPDILEALSENCHEKLKNEFSAERTVKKYGEYFQSLLTA